MVYTGGGRKICIVLKKHSTYYKVFLPTLTHRRKKTKRVIADRLKFPKAYFTNRTLHIQECQKHLTYVFINLPKIILFSFSIIRIQQQQSVNEALDTILFKI